MLKNIFRHEFKTNLRSVVTWSVTMVVILFVFEAMFTTFSQQAEKINEMMANYPPELLAAFGLNGVDLSNVLGFFSFFFIFVQICLAIQAGNYGFSLVSVEEREWTADFLLTRPIKRTQALTSKLLAALCGLAITDVVLWVATFASINLFRGDKTYATGTLLLLLGSVVIFQLFFFFVGLAVSQLVRRIRSVMPYSLGLAFGMYVLAAFGGLLGTNLLEKITPFKHFDPAYIVSNGGYNLPLVLVSLGVIAISAAAAYMRYARRDIPAVS